MSGASLGREIGPRRAMSGAGGDPAAARAHSIGFLSDGFALEGELVLPAAPGDALPAARGETPAAAPAEGPAAAPAESPAAEVLAVLCHGIPSGSPPDPADPGYAGLARDLAARGIAAFWFDFRGAREAPGDFSIAGWARDLEAALDALARDREASALRPVIVGSSAGGAVAVVVAAARPDVLAVATLAAPATFDFDESEPERLLHRLRNAGLIKDPAFPIDPEAWWREFDECAPERSVARISPRPLLVVHGDSDDVVPYLHAERLFALAGRPKELVRLPGGGHQLRRDARAMDAVADWVTHLPR